MQVFDFLELIGASAFAFSGAYIAMEKGMDLFGTFTLALITAVGGGVIRDVVMNVGVPRVFSSCLTILAALLAATIMIITKGKLHLSQLVIVCDAIGLSVFSVNAGVKAITLNYNLPEILFMAVITGVGGGVIRDLLAQRIPIIFKKEIYASAAIIGVLVLWLTHWFFGLIYSTYFSVTIIIIIRLISVRHGVNLPIVKPKI